MKERYELTLSDGQKFFGLKWLVNKPTANVLILEGMEEHSSRYDGFASFLNKKGFNVFCLDTFGQGENVKPDLSNRGIWPLDGFKKQVDLENEVVEQLKPNGLKTYIFAHSMGSFMAQSFIQRYPYQVEKVVLCGSGSKNAAVPVGYLLAKLIATKKKRNAKAKFLNSLMFGNFNKKIANPKTNFDWLSHNEENVKKYIADPLSGFGPNNGFCLEFLKGMSSLYKKSELRKINQTIKLFIISGEEDPVTNYARSVDDLVKMYSKFNVKGIESKVYSHLRHEVLNEANSSEVYEDIANFFTK
ncbi:MAG TPA: alpha/beta fold hydrolase [Bacilli bacterium]|nr:alpha/beta fold hydrolase [Bacilli bacterium]